MSTTLLVRGDVAGSHGWLFCACDAATVAYYCTTHDAAFPHREALAQHCRQDGEHHVCRLCPKHGPEAIPPKTAQAPAT